MGVGTGRVYLGEKKEGRGSGGRRETTGVSPTTAYTVLNNLVVYSNTFFVRLGVWPHSLLQGNQQQQQAFGLVVGILCYDTLNVFFQWLVLLYPYMHCKELYPCAILDGMMMQLESCFHPGGLFFIITSTALQGLCGTPRFEQLICNIEYMY